MRLLFDFTVLQLTRRASKMDAGNARDAKAVELARAGGVSL